MLCVIRPKGCDRVAFSSIKYRIVCVLKILYKDIDIFNYIS